MDSDATTPAVRRHIVDLHGRHIHVRSAGNGAHLLLIHGSPASSEFMLPILGQLADRYSCLAPDTPGFGDSDPLPSGSRDIPALAAATADLLDAVRFGPCLVLGTHTGAAIALDLAWQRPDLVAGLVLDGLALFDATEQHLFNGYFEPVEIDVRGGHFARTWTRIRDMFIWFPWTSHAPERLNGTDLPPVASTHRWVSMLFKAAPHYAEAYSAAIAYTKRGLTAAATQTRPAVYLAHERDMLAPHLSRLPALKPVDRVELTQAAGGEWWRAVHAALAELEQHARTATGLWQPRQLTRYARDQFIDVPQGQLRLQRFGRPTSPPLLLLHDAPGAGSSLVPLAQALSSDWCVWVPDLPGCGSSQALPGSAPSLDDYAASLEGWIGSIVSEPLRLYGRGCGAAVALQLLSRAQIHCVHAILDELLLTDGQTALPDVRFCPRIALEPDGAHWFRTWQQLRDSQIYWPWYDTSARALLRIPGEFSAAPLHAWTMQVLEQYATAHCLPQAVLGIDARALLARAPRPITLMGRHTHPLTECAMRIQATLTDIGLAAYDECERVDQLKSLLRGIHAH